MLKPRMLVWCAGDVESAVQRSDCGGERFVARGAAGLVSLSRRPHQSPARVLDEQRIGLILALRDERKLGPQRDLLPMCSE